MEHLLIKLSNYINSLSLKEESEHILKLSQLASYKSKPRVIDSRTMSILLQNIGLAPRNVEESTLDKAAIYLSEGINDMNLVMSGLSITSMIPGLQDVFKILKFGKSLDEKTILLIAEHMFDELGKIQFIFNKLKQKDISNYLKSYLPHGELLVIYSDRIFNAIKIWINNIINESKQKTQD